MVEALKTKGVGAAGVPDRRRCAADLRIGRTRDRRLSGITWIAVTTIGVVGMLIALAASWVILRGAALASRRIRLATRGADAGALERDRLGAAIRRRTRRRTFVLISVGLTVGCWIIVPILVAIGLAT